MIIIEFLILVTAAAVVWCTAETRKNQWVIALCLIILLALTSHIAIQVQRLTQQHQIIISQPIGREKPE